MKMIQNVNELSNLISIDLGELICKQTIGLGLTIGFLFLCFVVYLIRNYYFICVNCWFCNTNSRVHFANRNQFVCQSCCQYNGFSEGGDYNCTIVSQHNESENEVAFQKYRQRHNDEILKLNNGLCELCNFKQSLKVRAIADFSSLSDNVSEIENFRNKLEEMYDFCQDCEAFMHQALGKQNSFLKPRLIAWRILKSKSSKNFMFHKSYSSMAVRVLRILVVVISLYFVVTKLMICVFTSPFFTVYDGMLLHHAFKLDVVLANLGMIFSSTLYPRKKDGSQKLQHLSIFGWMLMVLVHSDVYSCFLSHQISYYLQLLSALGNFLFVTHSMKLAFSSSSLTMISVPLSCGASNSNSSAKMNLENSSSVHSGAPANPVRPPVHSGAPVIPVRPHENDLEIPLTNLKISHFLKSDTGLSSNQKSNCFRRTWNPNGNILQPSKLGNKITQSSWVAGGYWSESPKRRQMRVAEGDILSSNEDFDIFSRSSSQSSGFYSQTSEISGLHIPPCSGLPHRNWGSSAHSFDACSGSSCCSTACANEDVSLMKRDCPSSRILCSAQQNLAVIGNEVSFRNKYSVWCYICLAFALGFSICANVFLFVIFLKNDLI